MRRHSIICRLGPDDRTRISILQRDSTVTAVSLMNDRQRLSSGLGHAMEQIRKYGLLPSENAIDLAFLAATVYAADTRILRALDSQDGWTREIDLYVPVSNPALWTGLGPRLTTMLDFLTGDKWQLIFRKRIRAFQGIAEEPESPPEREFSSVSLFSGGLDSFIGVTDLLTAGESPLLVSHYGDGNTNSVQEGCHDQLRQHFPDRTLGWIRAYVAFPKTLVQGSDSEPTQRGRSFLFFALASLAASALRRETSIHAPENGFISLNVPLDPLRLGALSTRTTHPFFVQHWDQLLSALEIHARIVNPYAHKTKGEMIAECADPSFLKRHVPLTMSCSSPTKSRWRGIGFMHCGYCVPCLIRRASVLKALGEDPTEYSIPDLAAQPLDPRKKEGQDIRSFQVAISRMGRKPGLAKALIHKSGPLPRDPQELLAYEQVYRGGLLEVANLLRNVSTRPR